MIEIEGLVRRFGALTAVGGISLRVAKGEVLGFLGPNGAGKSTTMKMITGFLAPSEGWIKVPAGKTLDRKGRPLLLTLKGKVEAFYR